MSGKNPIKILNSKNLPIIEETSLHYIVLRVSDWQETIDKKFGRKEAFLEFDDEDVNAYKKELLKDKKYQLVEQLKQSKIYLDLSEYLSYKYISEMDSNGNNDDKRCFEMKNCLWRVWDISSDKVNPRNTLVIYDYQIIINNVNLEYGISGNEDWLIRGGVQKVVFNHNLEFRNCHEVQNIRFYNTVFEKTLKIFRCYFINSLAKTEEVLSHCTVERFEITSSTICNFVFSESVIKILQFNDVDFITSIFRGVKIEFGNIENCFLQNFAFVANEIKKLRLSTNYFHDEFKLFLNTIENTVEFNNPYQEINNSPKDSLARRVGVVVYGKVFHNCKLSISQYSEDFLNGGKIKFNNTTFVNLVGKENKLKELSSMLNPLGQKAVDINWATCEPKPFQHTIKIPSKYKEYYSFIEDFSTLFKRYAKVNHIPDISVTINPAQDGFEIIFESSSEKNIQDKIIGIQSNLIRFLSDPEVFNQEIQSWNIEDRSGIASSLNAVKTNIAYHKKDENFWDFVGKIFGNGIHFGKQEIHLHLPDSKSFYAPVRTVVDKSENSTFNN